MQGGPRAWLGLPGGTRTPDPQLRRLVLYPVELRAAGRPGGSAWSGRRDSNSRPTGPKPVALPGCATPRTGAIVRSGPSTTLVLRRACVAPNSTSRALSVRKGLRRSASTSTPRCTAGRAAMLVEPALEVRVVVQLDALVLPASAATGRWRCRRSCTRRRRCSGSGRGACRSRRRGAWPRWCSGRSRRGSSPARTGGSDAPGRASARRRPSGTSATAAPRSLPRRSCGQEACRSWPAR